jgi:PAS domain-containing protein
MLKSGSQHPMKRTAVLGYAVAVLSVGAALVALSIIQARWQAAAHVSILLLAVIVTTRLGGAGAGLLATALALLAFGYLLPQLRNPLADESITLLRLASFAVVACDVVWVSATDRRRTEGLARAHDEQLRHDDALRAESLERKRTAEELRASEAKFRALAESAPAAIFICQDDRIEYSNPAATVITGFSSAELFGKSFWDTAVPDSRESVRARAAARRSGEATRLLAIRIQAERESVSA